ncbi:MAG: hypothetical protein IJ537_07095 [Bacteroidaceae bacterium]|nr:hypothetical protein [Bacteroidaceae bacterium]
MKKTYQEPTVMLVWLLQRQHLLSGSNGVSGEISGYTAASDGFCQEDDDNPVKGHSNVWEEW